MECDADARAQPGTGADGASPPDTTHAGMAVLMDSLDVLLVGFGVLTSGLVLIIGAAFARVPPTPAQVPAPAAEQPGPGPVIRLPPEPDPGPDAAPAPPADTPLDQARESPPRIEPRRAPVPALPAALAPVPAPPAALAPLPARDPALSIDPLTRRPKPTAVRAGPQDVAR